MQKQAPAPIKPTNLPRHVAWAWLWLMKHVWDLVQDGPGARRLLQRMAHAIACLVLARVAARGRQASKPRAFRRRAPSSVLRAAIGSALRRRLKARGAGVRFSVLINALRDIDALTERLARRLARGLTRLCALVAARGPADPLVMPADAPSSLAADTS